MTGIERNSEVVQLAAYAPLLANVNHKGALCPTNLIIYDNHRCLNISYLLICFLNHLFLNFPLRSCLRVDCTEHQTQAEEHLWLN